MGMGLVMLRALGEIRLFAGIVDGGRNLPPRGWALCDGSLLPIIPNAPLYAILGTT